MEIKNMRKLESGNLKAFFSIDTDVLEINDFKLFQGKDGKLYIGMPQKEFMSGGQKKWSNIVFIKQDGKGEVLRDKITELAREEYFRDNKPESAESDDFPF